MKLTAIISLLALLLVGSTGTALAQEQKNCPFNIIGTWKVQVSPTEARLYVFEAEGTVKVLKVSGGAQHEIATGKYELVEDAVDLSREVSFTSTGKGKIFGRAKSSMKVVSYDDSSITCQIPGVAGTTRWTREDPNRYFIVFVARQGEFYDKSGSAFPLLVKVNGTTSTMDAVGIYSDGGSAVFGTVPVSAYKDYLREARGESEVILRLEINPGQYERSLKIVKEWQRRASEHMLLYDKDSSTTAPTPLNNLLVIKAVAETLNLCQNDFDMYKMDYAYPTDWITNQYSPEFVPFFFFKELKRRNEARHIEYKKFQDLVHMANLAAR
jgi:hypothetical protein